MGQDVVDYLQAQRAGVQSAAAHGPRARRISSRALVAVEETRPVRAGAESRAQKNAA